MFGSNLEPLTNFAWQQSLQISVLFLAVLSLSVWFRKTSANVRYVLWMLLIVKCLIPGIISIPIPLLETPSAVTISSSSRGAVQHKDNRLHEASNVQPMIARPTQQTDSTRKSVAVGNQYTNKVANSRSATTWSVPSIPQLLTLSWLGIACVLGVRIIYKGIRLEQQLVDTRVSVSTETTKVIDDLIVELAVQPICVRASTNVGQPFVWGWLRGTLYLPPDFDTIATAEQRRAILVHELAHIARWDATANLLQAIAQVLFFFHPLIWVANRRIRLEREKCCDEFVLAAARTNPTTYCDAIVAVLAQGDRRNQRATSALAVTGSLRHLESRITSILSADTIASARTSKRTWLLAACCACIALPTNFTLAQNSAAKEAQAKIGLEAALSKGVHNGEMLFRAIDAKTREPLEEVAIELQYQAEGIAFNDVQVQTTNEKGESLIVLPKGLIKTMRIYPTKIGYVPLRVYWEGDPGPQLPPSVTIPMHKGQTIGGTLLNQKGEPVANADVWIHYWGKGKGASPNIRVNICGDNHQSKGRTKSDLEGRWELNLLPSEIDMEKCHLYVAHPDYVSDRVIRATISIPVYDQPDVAALKDRSSVITLRSGETIRGLVKDGDGQPIRDAKIYFDRYPYNVDDNHFTVSDEEGNFEITSLDSKTLPADNRSRTGPKRFTIIANGFAPQRPRLTSTERRVPITLNPGRTILGRVVDEQGKPIEDAQVSAEERQLRLHTKTDANGDFSLSNVPPESTKFMISKQGYMTVEGLELFTRANIRTEIELTKPLRVHGQVVDADTGSPINNFKMWAGVDYDDGRAPQWNEWFGNKKLHAGGYEFRFSQSTIKYRLRVQAEGYMPMESDLLEPMDPAKREIPIDFRLVKTDAKVAGRILGLEGKPLANAKVYMARQGLNIRNRKVTSVRWFDRDFVTTDDTGQFEFPPEVEPFCIVVLHETGLGMATEEDIEEERPIYIEPWDDENHQQQIMRRSTGQQYVSFPK